MEIKEEINLPIAIIMLLDACCERMGVKSWNRLYDATKEIDEATKKFVHGKDNGEAIKTWFLRREF